ncbi:MAG TPA: putative metal-dependent hydrolase [Candidatus Acidoferrales bacterium]|nr:putative metal-dependent hydrolase [Candidatus Acidoferrales bacterium]
MATAAQPDLRYPVGKFQRVQAVTEAQRREFIATLVAAPARLRAAVTGLSDAQLDTPYRPGGWTVRQVAHHVPDSHMNAYIRFRLALTENEPAIKVYDEARWAELADAKSSPIEPSLALLENLHKRWVILLESLSPAEWKRTLRHPEMGVLAVDTTLALYAWHSRHHVAHITALRAREGW